MGCPERTPGPCVQRGSDVIFGDDLDVIFGDNPDVIFGIEAGVCEPPQVIAECAAELPCDEDLLPPVFHAPAISSENSVEIQLEGLLATDQIEVMIKEKYKIDGITKIFNIVDILWQQDEDAPNIVIITAGGGALVDGAYYTAFVRRERDGEVSPWSYDLFVATSQAVIVLLDGVDTIVDDDNTTVILDG